MWSAGWRTEEIVKIDWVYFAAKIVKIEWIQCVSRFRVQDSFVSHFESFNRTSSKESLVCESPFIVTCIQAGTTQWKKVFSISFFHVLFLSYNIQSRPQTSCLVKVFLPRWFHVQKLLTEPSVTKILGSVFFNIQNQFWTCTILDSQPTLHFSCETHRDCIPTDTSLNRFIDHTAW